MLYLADIPDDLLVGDRSGLDEFIRYHRDASIASSLSQSVGTYREYAAGNQKLTLTEKQKTLLEGVIRETYSDNVCAQIISEGAARLQFLKWTVDDPSLQTFLDTLYITSHGRMLSTMVHHDMLRDGNVCVSLGWNSSTSRVRLTRESWWNGRDGVFVLHDIEDPNEISIAVKEWPVMRSGDTEYFRRVVWAKGEITRWRSDTGADGTWEPYLLPEDLGRWPVPWVDRAGNPMRPPIVHYPNAGNSTDNYGDSELAGGILGSQDRVNDLQWVIAAAARLTGYQMYTMSGVKDAKDAEGNPVEPEIGPGAIIRSPSENARFGTLPAGDISQLLSAYEHEIRTIARNARIPLHRLGSGNPPSGEALLRAEGPAIGKAERQVDVCTPRWSQLGFLAAQIADSYGTSRYNLEKLIRAVMEEPDRRDKLSKSIIVTNLKGSISIRETLRMMEYPEDTIDKIMSEMRDEAEFSLELAQKISGGNNPNNKPGSGGGDPPPSK